MKKNIFIVGKQNSGKTTLLLDIYKEFSLPFCGYYTTDIIEDNVKKGYVLNNFNGGKGIFAHVNSNSEVKISKFGVDLDILDLIAIKPIEECLEYLPKKIIIMDEIGKKEFLSKKFENMFKKALSSKNIILATSTIRNNFSIERYIKRGDSILFEINQNNRNNIKEKIMTLLEELHNEIKEDPIQTTYYAKLIEY